MSCTHHTIVASPVGDLTLVATSDALVGLHWPNQTPKAHFSDVGEAADQAEHPILGATTQQLHEYFGGHRHTFDLPLAPEGDEFNRKVWDLLCEIDCGRTTTYGALANRLGNRHLAQRVGQAVGANPIGLIVPCHRVLGSDGSLTGFAGGLDTKRWLLAHEEPEEVGLERLF